MTSKIKLPIQQPCLDWWIECEEKDAHSALPSLYYTANVSLNDLVLEWCNEHAITPRFEVDRFEICEDCFSMGSPQLPVDRVTLVFDDDAGATLFKLRWC